MTRVAWFIGNWIGAIVFALRLGYRDGSSYRPGTRPDIESEGKQS